jgi:hypothetical protein
MIRGWGLERTDWLIAASILCLSIDCVFVQVVE